MHASWKINFYSIIKYVIVDAVHINFVLDNLIFRQLNQQKKAIQKFGMAHKYLKKQN